MKDRLANYLCRAKTNSRIVTSYINRNQSDCNQLREVRAGQGIDHSLSGRRIADKVNKQTLLVGNYTEVVKFLVNY